MKTLLRFKQLFHLGWFQKSWWNYLLEPPKDKKYINWFNRIWCRATGHRGCIWFNVNGTEPDYRCTNCYDDIE